MGRAAYQKVPEAARGAVTTGLFAWAKAYANSPAVTGTYPRMRTAAMPQRKQYARTIDEEIKKQLDDVVAANEQSKQMAASLPPSDRERLLANLKAMEDSMRRPAIQHRGQVAVVRGDDGTSLPIRVTTTWNLERKNPAFTPP